MKTASEWEDNIAGAKLFVEQRGAQKAAEFICHQQSTIDGLTKNLQAFQLAYREALEGPAIQSDAMADAVKIIERLASAIVRTDDTESLAAHEEAQAFLQRVRPQNSQPANQPK